MKTPVDDDRLVAVAPEILFRKDRRGRERPGQGGPLRSGRRQALRQSRHVGEQRGRGSPHGFGFGGRQVGDAARRRSGVRVPGARVGTLGLEVGEEAAVARSELAIKEGRYQGVLQLAHAPGRSQSAKPRRGESQRCHIRAVRAQGPRRWPAPVQRLAGRARRRP